MRQQKFRETHLLAFLEFFESQTKPLDSAFSNYLKAHRSIGAHDRRDIGDAAYAIIRWKGLLDFLTDGSPSWLKKFEIFSKLDLDRIAADPSIPLWVRCGASEWLFEELKNAYGETKAETLCRALNETAPVAIRANLLKISRDDLLRRLSDRFAVELGKAAPAALLFPRRTALTQLPEFQEGLFEIQDEGSQLAAEQIQAEKGDQVLDFCSGSGGKSLAIAPRLQGRGQIYLHDIRPFILNEAKKRLRRAGVQNAQFLPPDHPRLASLKNKIDWVLADVPCSGSGTYRRNPDMKWKGSAALLERLIPEQRAIATEALSYVRPGGHFVYATCSLFPSENERQIDFFLSQFPLTLVGPPLSIFPETNGPDGFFAAVLRKNSEK